MPIPVRLDFSAPASVSNPDGSAAFPLASISTVYPAGATQVAATSGVVAAASAVAAMPAVAGKTNYVTNIEFSGLGATGASVVTATLTGLLGGTRSYSISVPAGATLQTTPPTIFLNFAVPIAASAPNTAITWTVPSLGAGNTFSIANISGFVV